jgi:hypothetical protein
MRIWDISPGYLNRQSLLGEHRELHGIVSILVNGKKGYARHPETLRWVGHGWALSMRHRQLKCEMALRGYTDKSPVVTRSGKGQWPKRSIDSPEQQFQLLKEKYIDREEGRIPLPRSVQELWSHHKYSVLARSPEIYKTIGREVALTAVDFSSLALLFTKQLREQPTKGGIRNAALHMWGYVSDIQKDNKPDVNNWPLPKLLQQIQKRAITEDVHYLLGSTALSELMVWLPGTCLSPNTG